MKKMILPVVLCIFALATFGTTVSSCEKKDPRNQSATTSSKKPGNGAQEKLMPPFVTVDVAEGVCEGWLCGPPAFVTLSKNNYIQITKDAYTIANYPATMRYTLYVKGVHFSGNLYVINKVDEFDCSRTVVHYASPSLNNSTQYYIRISVPSAGYLPASDIIDITVPNTTFPFVSGTDKGQPC